MSGADHDVLGFDVDGVLSFRAGHEPDFEDQSSYSITIVASSGEGTRRKTATLEVTIEVVDAEDAGGVFLSQRQPEVGIVIHATASDPDGGITIRGWVWERSNEITVPERGPTRFPVRGCRWRRQLDADCRNHVRRLRSPGRPTWAGA